MKKKRKAVRKVVKSTAVSQADMIKAVYASLTSGVKAPKGMIPVEEFKAPQVPIGKQRLIEVNAQGVVKTIQTTFPADTREKACIREARQVGGWANQHAMAKDLFMLEVVRQGLLPADSITWNSPILANRLKEKQTARR